VATPESNGVQPARILEPRVDQPLERASDIGHVDARELARWVSQARISAAARERRRLARDLHDGVQNELVALIVDLAVAEQDRDTPPALAARLSALRTRAGATLDAIREIAQGVTPPILAAAGFVDAIRAQAERAPMTARLTGGAPRSSDAAETAVYFACLEALQNVAKHASRAARVTLRVRHHDGHLAVHIEDDGGGFVRIPGREGLGLTNIRDRITAAGGAVSITSTLGRGTIVAVALPWPARQAALRMASTASRLHEGCGKP
jgi:signal transduction histidine kinase